MQMLLEKNDIARVIFSPDVMISPQDAVPLHSEKDLVANGLEVDVSKSRALARILG